MNRLGESISAVPCRASKNFDQPDAIDALEARIVVLASGTGSNFQALAEWAARFGERSDKESVRRAGECARARIAALVSDKLNALVLARAEKMGIPAVCKRFAATAGASETIKKAARRAYDAELADIVQSFRPDFIFLLGWMRLLSSEFLSRFPGKVVNLHPALPGQFPGTHAIERAFSAFRQGKISNSGVMTHFVPDEGIDSGPTIAVEKVAIFPSDDLDSFEKRIHETEHSLVAATAALLIARRHQEGGFPPETTKKEE